MILIVSAPFSCENDTKIRSIFFRRASLRIINKSTKKINQFLSKLLINSPNITLFLK